MKKAEKAKIANTLTRTNSAKLLKDLNTLKDWEENHRRRKNSYFWSPSCIPSKRRAAEAEYTFTKTLAIGDAVLTYTSSRADSCNYIYWSDSLEISTPNANITFGDIAYIIACITDILAKRNTAKSA